MTKKIKNIVSLFVIGMILQSCGEEMGGVECIIFDVEDFKENWDDSEITTVDGVDDVVIYKYKGEKFTGNICYDFGSIDNTGFSNDDHRKFGKSLKDIERAIKYCSKKYPMVGADVYKAFQSRISYENGLKNGLEIGWAKYSDNRIDTAYVINWKHGYVDGKCFWYAYNSDFDYDETYNPNPCDTCKAFSSVINYKKGEKHGQFLHFDFFTKSSSLSKKKSNNDQNINFVEQKGTYKNGKINGSIKFYETTYRDDDDKYVVYLKSDNIYYKGQEIASKKYNSNEEISLAYSKSISVNWNPLDDDHLYPDTIVDGKKYYYSINDYNYWEMQPQGCRGGLADTWTQTRKNGDYVCEQDSNINLKSAIFEGWGDLVFIDKK